MAPFTTVCRNYNLGSVFAKVIAVSVLLCTLSTSGIDLQAQAAVAARSDKDAYLIGAADVLAITILNQMDMSGKFVVDSEGAITFPLLGKVHIAGLTPRGVENALRMRLADGIFQNPQVSVAIDEYHSQRIFVVGEVRTAGSYPLRGNTSLLEVLALAGASPAAGNSEVIIVRQREGQSIAGPLFPAQVGKEDVIRVDLHSLQNGSLLQNIALKNGDTIFVPKAESVFVYGQVRSPGAYGVGRNTTVMQVVALAGGATERGALNRITIRRVVNGKQKEIKAKLTDMVEPGDTLVVPERFF